MRRIHVAAAIRTIAWLFGDFGAELKKLSEHFDETNRERPGKGARIPHLQ